MQRAITVALCGLLMLAIFCPGLCLAKMAGSTIANDQHACCHKGKSAPEKPCSHASATQKAELPQAPSLLAAMVPAYWLVVSDQLVVRSTPAAPPKLFSPPPVLPLVLRI